MAITGATKLLLRSFQGYDHGYWSHMTSHSIPPLLVPGPVALAAYVCFSVEPKPDVPLLIP